MSKEPGALHIILDMDSSVSPTHGGQEGSAYNGHFGCSCYHPLFVFNQFGDLERCALRAGSVHSAHGWRDVLEHVVARYRDRRLRRYFRGDAAFASPDLYEFLEAEGYKYAIRLKANAVLQESIVHLLTRPVGRPPNHVRRFHASFSYQAGSWSSKRRVVAKIEWHPGQLFPRVGFIVTNLSRPAERVTKCYNGRGTAEQYIKEGKNAINWTRLSCHSFRNNEVRLQLHALAYNLANFMRTLALPKEVEHWSLTTLREKLVKIGAKVVSHGRYVTFQLAAVAVPRALFAEILRLIDGLRPAPLAMTTAHPPESRSADSTAVSDEGQAPPLVHEMAPGQRFPSPNQVDMERGPFWRAGLLPESPWEAHPVTIIANLGEPIGESRTRRSGDPRRPSRPPSGRP